MYINPTKYPYQHKMADKPNLKRAMLSRVCMAFILIVLPAISQAAVPAGFKETIVARNLAKPTRMAIAPDGRIFVAEQAGKIRVVDRGHLLPQPFLNITTKVDSRAERGLLGIAFDPNFHTNQWIYVYYTSKKPVPHNRVSRFTANGDVVMPGSEKILLEMQPLSGALNHNGGALHFGGDGKLYIGVGDNADRGNAQSLSTLKGKILRINKDGSIPADNPYYHNALGINRAIWAMGLRNPFSFAVQPNSGRIYINDVGQDAWEEVNQGIKGANYGWPMVEGKGSNPKYRNPIIAYSHSKGAVQGCAIVGSAFYNPVTEQFPSNYVGDYFYGDFCSGWIRRYDKNTRTSQNFATGIGTLVDIQIAPDGTLYYLKLTGGLLKAIRWVG